jgi:hypothetical protein
MCTINIIAAEIVELNAIKSAYNHYLASYEASVNVENATQVKNNKVKLINTLQNLYAALHRAEQEQQTKPIQRLQMKNYNYTEKEKSAIMHFNADRRFTITE